MKHFSEFGDGGPAITDDDLARARGLIAPAILVMAADGRVETSEERQLANAVAFNGAFLRIGPEASIDVVHDVAARAAEPDGADALLALTEALPQRLRETAICIALRISIADGRFEDAEHSALVGYAMRLGVTPGDYNRMADVLSILHRSS